MALLTVENLRKGYSLPGGGRREVVDVARFDLGAGEQAAMSGGSGSGKTTLLNLIAGITRADGGSVVFDGMEVTRLSEAGRDRLRAEKMGYVFQTFNLLQGYTALQNVELGMMFGAGVDRGFAEHLLERVGLRERMGDRPGQMSVGQQQRVALARALANKPRLVLADEPTGNLDAATAGEALGLIRGVCGENGAALLLVSHDAGVLGGFERVVGLEEINRVCFSATEVAPPRAEGVNP